MKELEKVKNISIASTLFILAILIGVLTYERPEGLYEKSTKTTLEDLTGNNHFVSMEEIKGQEFALVDVRSPYEYERGYIGDAVNIPTPEILKKENKAALEELRDAGKTIVLYGTDLEEANIPFVLLYQLGYDNIKMLKANNTYVQNNLLTEASEIEKPVADIKAFIDESVKNANKKEEVKEKPPVPTQVVTVKKKKKRPVEGGC